MHDLSALESNEQYEQLEMEGEDEEEDESELTEAEELEAAAELLSVGNEAELEDFLGDFIRKAASAVSRHVKSTTGNSIGSLLKGLAKQALPMVATAIGGPVGGALAKGGLDGALKAFGLELEGMSEEDQELELARRYVKVANAATRRALRRPARDPRTQARAALRWALRRYAPGILRRRRGWNRPHRNRHWVGRPMLASWAGGYDPRLDPNYDPSQGFPGGVPLDAYGNPLAAPAGSYGGALGAPAGQAGGALAPGEMGGPGCPPCPACPECGATNPPAPGQEPTPAVTGDTTGGAKELEFSAEDEFGYEDEEEAESEDEYGYGGYGRGYGGYGRGQGRHGRGYGGYGQGYGGAQSGRWVRRGNRIILFGA
ncbi:MAG TPA: hypothetical protein VGK73_40190 [Polyangiaceae bacterium]